MGMLKPDGGQTFGYWGPAASNCKLIRCPSNNNDSTGYSKDSPLTDNHYGMNPYLNHLAGISYDNCAVFKMPIVSAKIPNPSIRLLIGENCGMYGMVEGPLTGWVLDSGAWYPHNKNRMNILFLDLHVADRTQQALAQAEWQAGSPFGRVR
jgi:prepilin-type processing-associated H-X9-DG protein